MGRGGGGYKEVQAVRPRSVAGEAVPLKTDASNTYIFRVDTFISTCEIRIKCEKVCIRMLCVLALQCMGVMHVYCQLVCSSYIVVYLYIYILPL